MSVSVTKIVNLPQAALKFSVQDETDQVSLGAVFHNNAYAWLAKGAHLEVINTKTGHKIGAWTFGWVLKDLYTKIVCVQELQRAHQRHSPLLVVGIEGGFSGAMICVFNFVTSKVVRAVQICEKITSLHVVDSGNETFTLPSPLRTFDGIIAVGTAGGEVFLIDICRQICDEASTTGIRDIRDELSPCKLLLVNTKQVDQLESNKEAAVNNSSHLAIHLNVVYNKSTSHFILKGPKGEDKIHVNRDEVTVSSLFYCSQLGSILVGYNFGALQLFNLMDLSLVYTSPICEEHIPISHFAIQEPVDDPRAFCYVWSVYSSEYQDCLPLAVMYAFCYKTKEYHEGYGSLYQDFQYAAIHYQMELSLTGNPRFKPKGGRCLSVNSISRNSVNLDSQDDNLTLCAFVWTVCLNGARKVCLGIFDLNQWYKEQMPSLADSKYSENYLMQTCLTDLVDCSTEKSAEILDVDLNKKTISQFVGSLRLEEHFCPSSLSLDLSCLRTIDVVFLNIKGVQKALLTQIEAAGPLCLIEPTEMYRQIMNAGLLPLYVEQSDLGMQQREIILTTALENQLIGWLCKCATELSNGSFISVGCSLDWLIGWAFNRVSLLKQKCDEMCVPLFDYSEQRLDTNTLIQFNNCVRQISYCCTFYSFILRKLSIFLNVDVIERQFQLVQMISDYFHVLQWFLNVGLLPECPVDSYPRFDEKNRINTPYPSEILAQFYNHRRAILTISNEETFNCKKTVLFIDNLIENEYGGQILQEQWTSDGGNGLFPPPSLQALLRTYLVDNVDVFSKHSVIMYLFLDLAMSLDEDRYKSVITHLIKFPVVFRVSPSMIKIVQAFWQLDHGDYNTALGLLLDPLVNPDDLKCWHHKTVLKSLLLQNQNNFALLYFQVRKPPISDDDDILITISMYVANNMLDEAFYFEKHHNPNKENKFLLHFFNECKNNHVLKSLIFRCLSATDENFFLNYLENKQGKGDDLHVYYHILRSHFMEALESHDRTSSKQIQSQGLHGQQEALPREKLIYIFKKLLPEVNQNLLAICRRERQNIWRQVEKPTPMSVFVYNSNENVQYKSTVLAAALCKAKQTFNDAICKKFTSEETPFLKTPTVLPASQEDRITVIYPRIIDDFSPPPCKRLKLSPINRNTTIPTLETPIIKRKINVTPNEQGKTPHSILKIRGTSKTLQYNDSFKAFEKVNYTPVKSGFGLSPRKSLSRTWPSVHFEGIERNSLNSMKSTENSKEDTFYSTEVSLDDSKIKQTEVEENESPKARKGLKRSLDLSGNETPNATKMSKNLSSILDETSTEKMEEMDISTLLTSRKLIVSPRKSLCRKFLENNTVQSDCLEKVTTEIFSKKTELTTTTIGDFTEKIFVESTRKCEDLKINSNNSVCLKHSESSSILKKRYMEDTSDSSDFDASDNDSFPEMSDSLLEIINSKPTEETRQVCNLSETKEISENKEQTKEKEVGQTKDIKKETKNEDEPMEVNFDIYEDLSNSRGGDPEMNVFEITDDLSLNKDDDDNQVEKYESYQNNDMNLYYNCEEIVIDTRNATDNLSVTSSTSVNTLEKNIETSSISSSSSFSKSSLDSVQNKNEVIEIGSSSEDSSNTSKSDTSYSSDEETCVSNKEENAEENEETVKPPLPVIKEAEEENVMNDENATEDTEELAEKNWKEPIEENVETTKEVATEEKRVIKRNPNVFPSDFLSETPTKRKRRSSSDNKMTVDKPKRIITRSLRNKSCDIDLKSYDSSKNESKLESKLVESPRSRRSVSVSKIVEEKPKRLTRSRSRNNSCEVELKNDSKELEEGASSRVLRSSKTNDSSLLRSRSVSTEKEKPKAKPRNRRAISTSQLQNSEKVEEKKAKSVIEGYEMTRRMTRRQVNLLKQTMGNEEIKVATMDPIVLLDKREFEGKPDLEEEQVYETSPNTSVGSVTPKRITTRSMSVTSNVSSVSSKSEKRIKGRLRKDSSSSERTPTKKEENVRMTRSRAKSVSSDQSNVSEVSQKSSKKKKVSNLAKIVEEKSKK